MDKKLMDALTRRALGQEYCEETITTKPDGETATKKTQKYIPPDITAIKLLKQLQGGTAANPYTFYTNAELTAEIKKLYETMREITDGNI
ncbi:MAG: hypothetical protein LBQ05_01415 [Christensenellaceae bacterium]|jgi:hypothetical protein|nr:hypothetical protein [Christensenellaceae bacterium]